MKRRHLFSLVSVAVLAALVHHGDAPAKETNSTDAAFSLGVWNIQFTNGVSEFCDVFEYDGWRTTVTEPMRKARGTVAVDEKSIVLKFDDDRIERWTPVGGRYIVEHWYPVSAYPASPPVLGIADRAR